MADVELVIKIPEEVYEKIQKRKVNQYDIDDICQSVFEGTPLPKGHGRLRDVDIEKAQTIIEANMDVCQNNGNKVPSPQELLKMAGEDRPIDRSEIRIDTPKTANGLQSYNDGFDFLQQSVV